MIPLLLKPFCNLRSNKKKKISPLEKRRERKREHWNWRILFLRWFLVFFLKLPIISFYQMELMVILKSIVNKQRKKYWMLEECVLNSLKHLLVVSKKDIFTVKEKIILNFLRFQIASYHTILWNRCKVSMQQLKNIFLNIRRMHIRNNNNLKSWLGKSINRLERIKKKELKDWLKNNKPLEEKLNLLKLIFKM